MVVRSDIVEDFSQSLYELNDMLSISLHQRDPIYRGMVEDAQLFSFVRTSEVFRKLLKHIYDENCEDHHAVTPETALVSLCGLGLIDDEQTETLLCQLDLAEFFALDKNWLETEEDRRLFDGGIHELPIYCKAMTRLLDEVSEQCTLIECKENDEQGH